MNYKADGTIESLYKQEKTFIANLIAQEATQFTNKPAPTYEFLQALATSCSNFLEYADVCLEYIGVQKISNLLAQLDSYSLPLTPDDQAVLTNRLAAANKFLNFLGSLQISVSPLTGLSKGEVVVTNPGYIQSIASPSTSFSETAPQTVIDVENFLTGLQETSSAWGRIKTALEQSSINYNNKILDLLQRFADAEQNQYNIFSSSGDSLLETSLIKASPDDFWTWFVSLPVLTSVSSFYWNTTDNPFLQKSLLLKYALLKIRLFCVQGMYHARQQKEMAVQTTILRAGETLMDVANRTLGDYALWPELVLANNLIPPYISDVSSPGVLSPGDKVYLPGKAGQTVASTATYEANFLGTDINLGEIYSDMSAWTGDLGLTLGLLNYASALERRVLTLKGTLIYHNSYGCQSAALVGKPVSNLSSKMISAYVRAAFLSDPRTSKVLDLKVNSTSPDELSIVSTVQPKGPGSALGLDLVLQPPPLTS